MLFDGRFLQLIHLPGSADFTLLTFDIMHARANGRNAFAKRLCERNGIGLLGVVPKGPNWYPSAEIEQIADICNALSDRPVIAYGASMGGYGALRWGKRLGASYVLACSPQATIDPAATGDSDRRYRAYHSHDLHADMRVRDEHLPDRSVVLYDPRFRPDRFQAELLEGLSGLSNIAAPHMAHGTASCLAGSANALTAFDHLKTGRLDLLRRLILGRRKSNPTYRLELAATALHRKRYDLAETLAKTAKAENLIGYHMLMARRSTALMDTDAAAGHYEKVVELHPGHRIAKLRLERLRTEAGSRKVHH